MAKIVVQAVGNSIQVTFGDYSVLTMYSRGSWSKVDLHVITEMASGEYLTLQMATGAPWPLSVVETSESFQVDSVNGTPPTSNADLYDRLASLME